MGKRKLGALEKIDADLASLQYKIRRDPASYREEFTKQYEQYEAQRDMFVAAPGSVLAPSLVSFRDLIDFMAHVADCYPALTRTFPSDLIKILTEHHAELEPELREKMVGSLVLLRNKDVIASPQLLLTLFPILTTTASKALRALLFQKILSDLRSANVKAKDHRLNRTIQTVLFNLICADRTSAQGIWAVKLTRELWKRHVWTDARTVEIMKEASLADNEKVAAGGVRFFLGVDQDADEESSDDDEDEVDVGRLRHQAGVNKKTKKMARSFDKALATVKKKERKKGQRPPLNFTALQLLHDPQGFAEHLFAKHLQTSKTRLNLSRKLLVLQLVTRLVGLHQLTLINIYSYFLKYLTPRQPSVTSFLASLAQASHQLVPPDVLEPVVQKIAHEFVSEAAASEVAAAGLNAIREICVRQPLAMSDTLLQDLVMYRKSKDKGVMMAAKGLLSLYRDVGAELLRKKDRGKVATMGLRSGERRELRFGEVEEGGIEGLELLEAWKMQQEVGKREEGEGEDGAEEDGGGWEVHEDADGGDDESGGWIDVQSDGEIEISDSDDDDDDDGKGRPPAKKAKTRSTAPADLLPPHASPAKDSHSPEGQAQAGQTPESPAQDPPEKRPASSLATRKILTPADLTQLAALKRHAQINKLLPPATTTTTTTTTTSAAAAKHHVPQPAAKPDPTAPLTAEHISKTLPSQHARRGHGKGKDGDDNDDKESHRHRSKAHARQARRLAAGKSTTNRAKERKKNMLMTLGKARLKARSGKGGGGGGSGGGGGGGKRGGGGGGGGKKGGGGSLVAKRRALLASSSSSSSQQRGHRGGRRK
ncbi:MAG: Severe Depolymerization of Actin [Phylliscum demangeonii]|nr:MAG: Severe Depolymerization of Actin [Phylliscum demangeonii]